MASRPSKADCICWAVASDGRGGVRVVPSDKAKVPDTRLPGCAMKATTSASAAPVSSDAAAVDG
eukprot:8539716-Prorocentrum_lima.AAC.1